MHSRIYFKCLSKTSRVSLLHQKKLWLETNRWWWRKTIDISAAEVMDSCCLLQQNTNTHTVFSAFQQALVHYIQPFFHLWPELIRKCLLPCYYICLTYKKQPLEKVKPWQSCKSGCLTAAREVKASALIMSWAWITALSWSHILNASLLQLNQSKKTQNI